MHLIKTCRHWRHWVGRYLILCYLASIQWNCIRSPPVDSI